jgi:hypothetical protein
VQPVRKRLASITQVPASLAKGSSSADIEADVVYVGAGREADYAGKDVAGKIVLGNAGVGQVFNAAVNTRGAAGAIGTGSAGVSGNAAGFARQLGWSSVAAHRAERFGFVLSLRQMLELRGYIERGQRIVMRAREARRRRRMNVISAAIPSSDRTPANAGGARFRTIATPGASDNCAEWARWRSHEHWRGSSATACCRSRGGRSASCGCRRSQARGPTCSPTRSSRTGCSPR